MSHHHPTNSRGIAAAPSVISIIHHCQVCPRPIPLLSCECRECGLNSGFCPNCGRHQFCKFCHLLGQICPNINQDVDLTIDETLLSDGPSEEVPMIMSTSSLVMPVDIVDTSPEPLKTMNSSAVINDVTDSALRTRPNTSSVDQPVDKQKTLPSARWEIIKDGSRKKKDLLRDGLGNEYTRRSGGVWQCTKKRDNLTMNRCQAIVREKNGKFINDPDKRHSHGTR